MSVTISNNGATDTEEYRKLEVIKLLKNQLEVRREDSIDVLQKRFRQLSCHHRTPPSEDQVRKIIDTVYDIIESDVVDEWAQELSLEDIINIKRFSESPSGKKIEKLNMKVIKIANEKSPQIGNAIMNILK